MDKKFYEFSNDVYDVIAKNTDNCTQDEFFNKYVKDNDDFYIDCIEEENVIHFGEFKITIEREDE